MAKHRTPSEDCKSEAGANDEPFFMMAALSIADRKQSSASLQESLSAQSMSRSLGPTHNRYKYASVRIKPITKEGHRPPVKRVNQTRRRRILYLEQRVAELQKEISYLKRNDWHCSNCKRTFELFHDILAIQTPQPQPEPCTAGPDDSRRSRDSLQFEKMDFSAPIAQNPELQEKLWIFLGTMLIAMGSKIMDVDGTMNTFKILKDSVDSIRRQVDKCQPKLNLDFFCSKEELQSPIDGMDFNPFFEKQHGSRFTLQGVQLQSLEEWQLCYDTKYGFTVQYDALITIMQFIRERCSCSTS